MDRRRVLRLLGAVGAVGITGCTESEDDEDDDDFDPEEELEDEDHIAVYQAMLDDVTFEDVRIEDDVFVVEYVVGSRADDERDREITRMAEEFAIRFRDGLGSERMEASGYQEGALSLTWHVEREWAEEYNDTKDLEGFRGRVLDTVEEH